MNSVVGNGRISITPAATKNHPVKKFSFCGCCLPANRGTKYMEDVESVYMPNGKHNDVYRASTQVFVPPFNSTFRRPMNIPQKASIWHSEARQNGYSPHHAPPEIVVTKSAPISCSLPSTSAYVEKNLERELAESVDLEQGAMGEFETARTSRQEETSRYISMAQLVGQIREEAGLVDTPRPPNPSTLGNGQAIAHKHTNPERTELRGEILVKAQTNNLITTNPSNENVSTFTSKPKKEIIPSVQQYSPSLRRHLATVPQNVLSLVNYLYVWIATSIYALIEKLL